MADLNSKLNEFLTGFKGSMDEGSEDFREAYFEARKAKGKDPTDSQKFSQMIGTNPTVTTLRDLTGTSNPEDREARRAMGMGLKDTKTGKAGQLLGRLGNDIINDKSRSIWWLLNAPQAVATVGAEAAVSQANPNLYKQDYVQRPGTNTKVDRRVRVDPSTQKTAVDMGILDEKTKRTRAGYSKQFDPETKQQYYTKRRYAPGAVATLTAPAALAINAGMGLTNFMGGTDGYTAAMPSQEDPTKTSNIIGEVAAKYILGRTGQLLPWDEFRKVRPDVSKGDYMRYKAFKYDKKADLNPFDDGNITLPTGVLKATTEGIHGPEVQFLGRSLPVATTILPTVTAIAGTASGVRTKTPIRQGLIRGFGGYAAGAVVGNIIENERRNRNQAAYAQMPRTMALNPESSEVGF